MHYKLSRVNNKTPDTRLFTIQSASTKFIRRDVSSEIIGYRMQTLIIRYKWHINLLQRFTRYAANRLAPSNGLQTSIQR